MKILVVDDSPLVRAILTDCLNEEGYEVYAVGTSSEAEELFSQLHPELIIKDLYMPEGDAISSIQYFKNLDSKVKIVICSTGSSKPMILNALKAGAQDVLLKPLDKKQVVSLIKRITLS
jgi:two-component system chemotaxis response regulator CheY